MYLRLKSFSKYEITKGKIHAEQFSEEEKLLKFTDIATKVIEYHGSDFCDVECTEKQFGYYLQFGCCGMAGSFGYEKNIMTSVCKWVKIPYFLN
jgi:hypothetical protein